MTKALELTFRACYCKTRNAEDWNAEELFAKKYAHHELLLQYKAAREETHDGDWIHLSNEMCRSDWREFLSTV